MTDEVQDPKIALTLPLGTVSFLLSLLGEVPAKVSMGIIDEIKRQTHVSLAALPEPEGV